MRGGGGGGGGALVRLEGANEVLTNREFSVQKHVST